LAQHIEWAFAHPKTLNEMREAARSRAEHFTWQRFRAGVLDAVTRFQAAQMRKPEWEGIRQYV
jgi:glycosyltransferase involved in cell wall biosynthesis